MSPVEIIAYRGGEGSDQFADIEVLEGTEEQIIDLRKSLVDNWRQIADESITIVYQGTDPKAAREAIMGLPRVSEEVGL
ncbi:hypothetical protein A3J20_03990 [Candidatus Gottesmanbacteria bacterium RIFCSPLOWO2_02_FULL_42_29]|uniref:Uncharacterized protein n=2 Tax=Candidatus Gottesmaniibacteriota TaxID=1752720 RepID=A0A1F6BBS7_9BACT|nr:MAG: hypothetical protein UV09_C0018G0032 [Candidatus Gottesmanbacteria bacterium GW2011_GWA2_42_18]OGG10729.1 MAG: hypothetical protein A2781_03615 [Candidatus Gottesmanbacteria bacterium RIFCSPHIGHO2_01_FULL_42_27]OGG21892.1 MAG: hypothetical protein A3E72_01550 [Candidatus Gottesmanbacteria bacterium RIFCSPHIGHO2_12_FULL_43_26]OGG34212.1 MAG: hypothetical protein A2968_03535 [Candidatus Gottesmanbacteria bacterium RIFCSPLOWO2_01_FULL_42_22]OGG36110.1 MAG: hypothetical protein A3G68_03800 